MSQYFHFSPFLPSFTPLSQNDPFSQVCIPNAPPLLVTDSIHHSTHITDPSAPIGNQILEDHFTDLPNDLSIFIPNDITDNVTINSKPISKNYVLESTRLLLILLFLLILYLGGLLGFPNHLLTFKPINLVLFLPNILLPILFPISSFLLPIHTFAIVILFLRNLCIAIK